MADLLLRYRKSYVAPAGEPNEDDPRPSGGRGWVSLDAERRKAVERAAIAAVQRHYDKAYTCRDRQKESCGYDLEFLPRRGATPHLHVEVKGTALQNPHFLITNNERAYAQKLSRNDLRVAAGKVVRPLWRLAMVTDALGRPKVEIMTFAEVEARFAFDIVCWHATQKPRD